jgi:GT2 family glycosyltransferase
MFSILIVSYNRPDDTFDTVTNILTLDKFDDFVDEIIIVNNCSTISYANFETKIESLELSKIKYYKTEKNLGVAGGRNFGIKKSIGDILVFIDDDAIFEGKDVLNYIYDAFRRKECDLIAFKSKDFYRNVLNKNEFPHRNEEYINRDNFETYFFVGVGHAIRKNVFAKIGLYPEDFFYGMEEYDLSYRAIDEGFKIIYDSRIVVLHKKVQAGRQSNEFVSRKLALNKMKVAYRNLPIIFLISHVVLWSCKYLLVSKINFAGLLRLLLEGYTWAFSAKRKVITKTSIKKIASLGGRLVY